MSTVTRIVTTCDKCEKDISEHPAQRVIAVDGMTLKYDLCQDDDKALADALGPWLEFGQAVDKQGVPKQRRRRATKPVVKDESPAVVAEVELPTSTVVNEGTIEISAPVEEPAVDTAETTEEPTKMKAPRKRAPRKSAADKKAEAEAATAAEQPVAVSA